MKPSPPAAPTNPKFFARSPSSLTSAMYALAVPKLAPVMPATTRPANSHAIVGANPISR